MAAETHATAHAPATDGPGVPHPYHLVNPSPWPIIGAVAGGLQVGLQRGAVARRLHVFTVVRYGDAVNPEACVETAASIETYQGNVEIVFSGVGVSRPQDLAVGLQDGCRRVR